MKRLFLRDVGIISLAQVIAGIISFYYTIVAARILGVSDYGLFQSIMALYGTCSVFVVSLYLATVHCVGMVSEDRKKQAAGEFIRLAFVGGVVLAVIIFALSPWLSDILHADNTMPILSMALLLVSSSVLTAFYGALQSKNRHLAFSIAKICESAIRLVAGVCLMILGARTSGALLGYVLAMTGLAVFFFTRRSLYELPRDFSRAWEGFRSTLKILLAFGLLLFIDSIPVVIGRVRLTEEMSGLYGSLYNLRNVLMPFAYAVSVPFYTRTLAQHREPMMMWQAIGLAAILGGGFIVVGYVIPERVIGSLYGDAFLGAAQYVVPYGFVLFLGMVAMIFIFHQAAKDEISIPWLLAPLVVLVYSMSAQEMNLSKLITAQIMSLLTYLLCMGGKIKLSKLRQ